MSCGGRTSPLATASKSRARSAFPLARASQCSEGTNGACPDPEVEGGAMACTGGAGAIGRSGSTTFGGTRGGLTADAGSGAGGGEDTVGCGGAGARTGAGAGVADATVGDGPCSGAGGAVGGTGGGGRASFWLARCAGSSGGALTTRSEMSQNGEDGTMRGSAELSQESQVQVRAG